MLTNRPLLISSRQLSVNYVPESHFQARLDLGLGLCFLCVAVFAGFRLFKTWSSASAGRRVISVFNSLLFLASVFRAIWFLIPNDCLEPSYEPLPKKLQDYKNEVGLLVSEVLLSCGSFFLYGVFILIACYWYSMLAKLESGKSSSGDTPDNEVELPDSTSLMTPASRDSGRALGTLEIFFPIMISMVAINAINILLFSWGWFDTESLATIDAIAFALFAVGVLIAVVYLSHKINRVLRNMEVINQSSSQAQIRRIEAIVFLAKFFFATRIIIELGMCWWMLDFPHVFGGQGRVNDQFWWNSYIIAKHAVEVLVLTLELFISSAIRSYDNRRVTSRLTPLVLGTNGNSFFGAMASTTLYSGSSGVGIELHDSGLSSGRRASYGSTFENTDTSDVLRPYYVQQPVMIGSTTTTTNGRLSLGSNSMGYNYHAIPSVPIEGRIEAGTIRYSSGSGVGTAMNSKPKGYSGVLSVPLSSSVSSDGSNRRHSSGGGQDDKAQQDHHNVGSQKPERKKRLQEV